ncbi:hypothetical protein FN846DRAFT_1003481 [Sphaerosporella brunnea]|uniref:Uncharacterized protein n=1 Tax=Sphaerosporella brunnea TaxID=1250544 RepID=A0A5J5EEL7_9PEZI|nr:hypothetical protein FN846DRAFT_1003481 [Sphaerosporella brunnea]
MAKAPKALASRYFQLRLNKAPTAPYLMWTGCRTDDKCWWCRKAPKQTREHLLKRCARWKKEQEALWKAIGLATKVGGKEGWKRTSTPVVRILADARCTEALLGFLSSTYLFGTQRGWLPGKGWVGMFAERSDLLDDIKQGVTGMRQEVVLELKETVEERSIQNRALQTQLTEASAGRPGRVHGGIARDLPDTTPTSTPACVSVDDCHAAGGHGEV